MFQNLGAAASNQANGVDEMTDEVDDGLSMNSGDAIISKTRQSMEFPDIINMSPDSSVVIT